MAATRRWNGKSIFRTALLAAAIAASVGAVDVVSPPPEVHTEASPRAPLTGPPLRRGLESPVPGVAWKNAPLRGVLRQISDGYSVVLLCDRRIDPTSAIDFEAANVPLQEILKEIAADAGGEARLVGNTIYFGPPHAAKVVRTLVELRSNELDASGQFGSRAVRLRRPQTVAWGDLTESAEVLRLVTARFGLDVENPEALPHDLWAGATLPEMTAAEMLTLVLIQFDLTFAWGDGGTSIRLVPLPDDLSQVVIERVYPTVRPEATLETWREQIGDFDAEASGRRLVVRGRLELHEAIGDVLAGHSERRERPTARPVDAAPLSRRRFTLTVSRVPAKAVMDKLAESGIVFEYDADALTRAGVDLNAPVAIDVRQADATEFLGALFGPLGVAFEAEGVTVRLRPADR